jgi:glycosyltransferase involved in cell wall biosynthesis
MAKLLSIVVPVFNEAESLKLLLDQLKAVEPQIQEAGFSLEILFIDDGSTDASWDVVQQLASANQQVRGIRFRRNFGKAAALAAGFEAVDGPLVITMDGDLQDDPAEIPRFLQKMDEGLDVVSGWKQVRHDPWHKVLPSRVFNWLVGRLTGVRLHDHNCGFKCYRRRIFDEVRLYGEMHRFVPVLAAARGWKVGEIVVHHRPREFGASKYGVKRIIKGFLDLLTVYFLTDYGQRPLHLLGSFGLFFFLLGGSGITVLSAWWVLSRWMESIAVVHLHERAIFYYSITAFLLGAQFMTAGFLAELITAFQGRQQQTYSICERVGGSDENPTETND